MTVPSTDEPMLFFNSRRSLFFTSIISFFVALSFVEVLIISTRHRFIRYEQLAFSGWIMLFLFVLIGTIFIYFTIKAILLAFSDRPDLTIDKEGFGIKDYPVVRWDDVDEVKEERRFYDRRKVPFLNFKFREGYKYPLSFWNRLDGSLKKIRTHPFEVSLVSFSEEDAERIIATVSKYKKIRQVG